MQQNFQFIEKQVEFGENADGLFIKHTQEIPDEFLDELAMKRVGTLSTPEGEFMHVASIPEAVVDQWRAEGFDIYREPTRAVVARLKRYDLEKFLATNKRV